MTQLKPFLRDGVYYIRKRVLRRYQGVEDRAILNLCLWTDSLDIANFAWVQHIVHHLSPAGTAGFVLSNGLISSNKSSVGEIRKKLIEKDVLDCMVALRRRALNAAV